MPLLQAIAGVHFPKSHTRRYLQRSSESPDHPATVLVGTQSHFEYDAIAELIFDDETAFQTFFGVVSQKEAAEKIAEDEEKFLNRARMTAVAVDDCTVTTGSTKSGRA